MARLMGAIPNANTYIALFDILGMKDKICKIVKGKKNGEDGFDGEALRDFHGTFYWILQDALGKPECVPVLNEVEKTSVGLLYDNAYIIYTGESKENFLESIKVVFYKFIYNRLPVQCFCTKGLLFSMLDSSPPSSVNRGFPFVGPAWVKIAAYMEKKDVPLGIFYDETMRDVFPDPPLPKLKGLSEVNYGKLYAEDPKFYQEIAKHEGCLKGMQKTIECMLNDGEIPAKQKIREKYEKFLSNLTKP